MELINEKRKEFEYLARKMMKFISENCHPHTSVYIDSNTAELNEGIIGIQTDEYINNEK